MSILIDDGAGVVGRHALTNLLSAGESLRPLLGCAKISGGGATHSLILEGPLLSDAAEIRFFGRGGMSGYRFERDGAFGPFLSSRGVLPERQAEDAGRRFGERFLRWREFGAGVFHGWAWVGSGGTAALIRLREGPSCDNPGWCACAFMADPPPRGSDFLTEALRAVAPRLREGVRVLLPPPDRKPSAMEALESEIRRDELGSAAEPFLGNACGAVLELRAGTVSVRPLYDRPHREFLLGCVHA